MQKRRANIRNNKALSSPSYKEQQRNELLRNISNLQARLAGLKARLPAHSIPPGMIAELDEIDEQLALLQAELNALED
jgi:hypothetical protein